MNEIMKASCQASGIVLFAVLMGCEPLDDDFADPPGDPRCPYSVQRFELDQDGVGWLVWEELGDQVSTAGALCATANDTVSRQALDKASRMSTAMLANRPDFIESLQRAAIIILLKAPGETWCEDLWSFSHGTAFCHLSFNEPEGWFGKETVACPEEDLRICVHELAHAVYARKRAPNFGAEALSDYWRNRIHTRFSAWETKQLWRGDYALTNADEFFAEMSAIYFCASDDEPTAERNHGINCAHELREYDPSTYELIDEIYRGSADLR